LHGHKDGTVPATFQVIYLVSRPVLNADRSSSHLPLVYRSDGNPVNPPQKLFQEAQGRPTLRTYSRIMNCYTSLRVAIRYIMLMTMIPVSILLPSRSIYVIVVVYRLQRDGVPQELPSPPCVSHRRQALSERNQHPRLTLCHSSTTPPMP
jgi:hypothetical protein